MCLALGQGLFGKGQQNQATGSFDRVFDAGCELPKRVFKTSVSNTFCVSSSSCLKNLTLHVYFLLK